VLRWVKNVLLAFVKTLQSIGYTTDYIEDKEISERKRNPHHAVHDKG
jgi:hypothetical protein